MTETTGPRAEATLLRRALIAIVMLGTAGLLAELGLLEHWDDPWQWAPLVLLGVGLVLSVLAALRPGRRLLRAFEGLMALYLLAGALGVLLHYRGNAEFEREREPSMGGLRLVWEAARGATPALAPGALVQLGLIGLLFAYRHPVKGLTTEHRTEAR